MKKKHCLEFERKCRDYILENISGCHVVRVAGSGQQNEAVSDLILLTKISKYLIEVKSTKEKKFCFCGQQRIKLIETSKKINAIPILAVRFKRRTWVFSNLLIAETQTVRPNTKCYIGDIE